ncbi:PREDICTED: glycolipid transfer protein-like [Priapulus caudatus]|uniref:Glycolipid transfer protein-like n=1 Tax=Priapulus caudatus TaxID=37621 RepID=A0ABM1F289_PRICU|nr:PREDICTED: glycolipid transfer protein-like [Priapulus caudatus]
MTNFFNGFQPRFSVPEDKRIDTKQFLDAASNIPAFFDLLSSAFKPVKSDVNGNVTKLRNRYLEDPEKFRTLNDLIDWELELIHLKSPPKVSVIDALLWLKRGLQYISVLLGAIVKDHRDGRQSELMSEHAASAYERTLKPHHNWMTQKLFQLCSKAVPYRRDFLKAACYGEEADVERTIGDMEAFLANLDSNLDVIAELYDSGNLHVHQR